MGHSYVHSDYHCVFTTKGRYNLLTPAIRERLFPYLGGIARENLVKPVAIGGIENHVHLLLSLPGSLAIAKAMQLLKGASSAWMNDTFRGMPHFGWQEGYGAFSIGLSQRAATIAYIQNQEEHHRHQSFEEEFRAFLRRHAIAWEEQHVFG